MSCIDTTEDGVAINLEALYKEWNKLYIEISDASYDMFADATTIPDDLQFYFNEIINLNNLFSDAVYRIMQLAYVHNQQNRIINVNKFNYVLWDKYGDNEPVTINNYNKQKIPIYDDSYLGGVLDITKENINDFIINTHKIYWVLFNTHNILSRKVNELDLHNK